jgi:histidyl-tRNA synthetase
MSEKNIQPVRGTHDLMGDDYRKHQWIGDTSSAVAQKYGYEPIATPIVEYTSVFQKPLGETSDIVGKEMYTFDDRGGDSITIRPENTAGVVRAVISNGLTQSMPLKLLYNGPMMRYERPQKGRTRQFHQIGIECLGIADPLVDVETIAVGAEILNRLGVLSQTTLQINTIGDTHSRQSYRQSLIDYFTPISKQLSTDSQTRLIRNPMRILDSKDAHDQQFIVNAPTFDQYLSVESKNYFEKVCHGLELLGIKYKHNPRLVRGLDYYCHTAFEFISSTLGAQDAVIAGGRYDGLVAQMGGPEIPAIGWAMGIDRIALMINQVPSQPRPVAMIAVSEDVTEAVFQLVMNLRNQGIFIEFAYTGNIGKKMKKADKVNSCAAVLIGPDEISSSQATVRNLDTGDQKLVAFANLKDYLVDNFKQ